MVMLCLLLAYCFQKFSCKEMIADIASTERQPAVTVATFSRASCDLTVLNNLEEAVHLTHNTDRLRW